MTTTRVGPGDPRYQAVLDRRFNRRFRGSPEHIYVAASTAEVQEAVQEAVAAGRRLVATSGGHCLEGFVSDPDVRVVLDVSPMKRVYWDDERAAVAVEAGATVGDAFRVLHEQWGVLVPLGEYPGIGIGGHVAGGAFGFLCREHGLAADYLHAVELVTVDAAGRAGAVVATRDPSDPDHDLWWAHTGGGAGNFGVITRYWFRAPDATGDDPRTALPRSPASITTFEAEWSWSALGQSAFARLLRNHGVWCERNSEPDSPGRSLWSLLEIHRRQLGPIVIRGLSTAGGAAAADIQRHLDMLSDGIAPPAMRKTERLSWPEFALHPFPELFAAPPGGVRVKVKDALLRRRLSDRQIEVAHRYLTDTDYDVAGGMLGLATYGGRINAVPRDATAASQRDAIVDMACTAGWLDETGDAENLRWVREFYGELFAETGGAPVPGEAYAGALINHPDTDLADPALNTSGVSWERIYYPAGYPRLQRCKARWDPGNVFRHALSIRPPER